MDSMSPHTEFDTETKQREMLLPEKSLSQSPYPTGASQLKIRLVMLCNVLLFSETLYMYLTSGKPTFQRPNDMYRASDL